MKPYYQEDGCTIYHGDCREVLCASPPESVHAIVTDPPYGLSFMGKRWDYDVPSVEAWRACWRVLKPGGHLLAFSGTRTYHRAVINIEDASFEIRDMVGWIYGTGFPKSRNLAKDIDNAAGAGSQREVIGTKHISGNANLAVLETTTYGSWAGTGPPKDIPITAPATEAAKQWDGWGTGLKPAHEPICLARKPLDGTVAANVLAHGTGALNIEACRVGTTESTERVSGINKGIYGKDDRRGMVRGGNGIGRWPANLIHDGSPEVLAVFPQSSGQFAAVSGNEPSSKTNNVYGQFDGRPATQPRNDSGSAARFFYTAKADAQDRGIRSNDHPTVKPTDLIRYLVMLIAPPGGVVLDPFMGSGTTLRVAKDLGHPAVGIDSDEHSCEIAAKRLGQGVLKFT